MLRVLWRYLPYAILASLMMVGEVLCDLMLPEYMTAVVDNGILKLTSAVADSQKVFSYILTEGGYMLLILAAGGVCGCLCNVFLQYSSQSYANALRKRLFKKIMSLSYDTILSLGQGTLITRVTNDISQVERLMAMLFRGLVRTLMMMLGSIYFMFRLNTDFGLLLLCAFPVLMVLMFLCIMRANPLFFRLQQRLDALNTLVLEDLLGYRLIKAYVREAFARLRFHKANLELIRTQFKILIFFAFMNPFVNILMNMLIAILLVKGEDGVTNGTTTPGVVMAALTYATMLINSLMMLLFLSSQLSKGFISYRRIAEVDAKESTYSIGRTEDKPLTFQSLISSSPQDVPLLLVDNLSFTYPLSKSPVLKNLHLSLRRGEFVAITGPTASGKSTLINILLSFFKDYEGSICILGRDLYSLSDSELSSLVSPVFQSAEILSGTLKKNITFCEDKDIEPNLFDMAVSVSLVSDFALARKDGFLDTVSEGGFELSGGQKQRLSLARALYHDAPLMLLDDATSALDLNTERTLFGHLREDPKRSVLIVSTRLNVLKNCDRILVLENGRISYEGTHESLLAQSAFYRELSLAQEYDIDYDELGVETAGTCSLKEDPL